MQIIELEEKQLNSKDSKKAVKLINQARDIFQNETDPDQERLIAFNQSITAGCSIYKNWQKGYCKAGIPLHHCMIVQQCNGKKFKSFVQEGISFLFLLYCIAETIPIYLLTTD